ncbi:hypothetical protein HMPREF1162_1038 [ [[Propionibacterium] namnetense SK182B-JCVI]|uniref:Uncharacterized protein n=1 Tax=[Propionibacterium] namnetense SK182B-JCVI TaxID=1051006 RepID=F9NXN8_9ACTN|nr:hypothetical protein HMPREF1162_1038 [ [[Propionibacterium] namnetense SK182B-JCVI]
MPLEQRTSVAILQSRAHKLLAEDLDEHWSQADSRPRP